MVFGSALTLATFALVLSGCMFQFIGLLFLYFFQKFPNFCLQIYILGLGFAFRVKVQNLDFKFSIFLPRKVHCTLFLFE